MPKITDDSCNFASESFELKQSKHFEFEFDYSKILPTNDIIFKRIFWNKDHPDILICFLNAVLKREDPITSVELINTEMDDQFIGKHGIRLDLLGRTNNGELLNIEMQNSKNSNNDNMFKRSLYYWSKVYSSQLDQGQSYEKLVPVIAINILDFNLFADNRCQRKFIITDAKTGKDEFKMLEIHFIELKKRQYMNDNKELFMWAEFLKSPNSNAIEVGTQNRNSKAILNAKGIYNTAIASNEDREKIRLLNKTLADNESRVITARNEGLVEGKKNGEHKKAIETAKNLLVMGLTFEQISKATGLTTEEIEKL